MQFVYDIAAARLSSRLKHRAGTLPLRLHGLQHAWNAQQVSFEMTKEEDVNLF